MSDQIREELQEFIRTLSTEICKEVLLEDLRQINGAFHDTVQEYRDISARFSGEADRVQKGMETFGAETGDLSSYVRAFRESGEKIDRALEYINKQNESAVEAIQERYDDLFRSYRERIQSSTREEREAMLAGFRNALSTAGDGYLTQLRGALDDQKLGELIEGLSIANLFLSDLVNEKERLRTQLRELCADALRETVTPAGNELLKTAASASNHLSRMRSTAQEMKEALTAFQEASDRVLAMANSVDENSRQIRDTLEFVQGDNQRFLDTLREDNHQLLEEHQKRLRELSAEEHEALAARLSSTLDLFSDQYLDKLRQALEEQDVTSLPSNLASINAFFQELRGDKETLIREITAVCEQVLDKNIKMSGVSLTKTSLQLGKLANEIKQSATEMQGALTAFQDTSWAVRQQTRVVEDNRKKIEEALGLLKANGESVMEGYRHQLEALGERQKQSILETLNSHLDSLYTDSVAAIRKSMELNTVRELGQTLAVACLKMKEHEEADQQVIERLSKADRILSKLESDLDRVDRQCQNLVTGTKGSLDALTAQVKNQNSAMDDAVSQIESVKKQIKLAVICSIASAVGMVGALMLLLLK